MSKIEEMKLNDDMVVMDHPSYPSTPTLRKLNEVIEALNEQQFNQRLIIAAMCLQRILARYGTDGTVQGMKFALEYADALIKAEKETR